VELGRHSQAQSHVLTFAFCSPTLLLVEETGERQWDLFCCRLFLMDEHRKKALIVIAAAILAARRLAAAPRNSPAYMSALSDAVSDAKKIIERVERES